MSAVHRRNVILDAYKDKLSGRRSYEQIPRSLSKQTECKLLFHKPRHISWKWAPDDRKPEVLNGTSGRLVVDDEFLWVKACYSAGRCAEPAALDRA